MKLSSKRETIVAMHRAGSSNSDIAKSLKVARSTVWSTVKRYKERGDFSDRPRCGRPRSKRTLSLVKAIRERIRRNPKRSFRKMAKDCETSPRTMRRIVNDDLGMSSFTLQKKQTLTKIQMQKRMDRGKVLFNEMKRGTAGEIVWSDEKLFTVEMAHNRRNDRVIGKNASAISPELKRVCHTMKPASVMVWAAISSSWKSPLIFVKPKCKINAKVYINDILKPMFDSASKHFANDELWTFQQDGTAHTANITQTWCRDHLPRFWSKEMWPPCSPDLNPMDFSVWSILESRACSKVHRSVEDLKSSLLRAWDEIPQELLHAAASGARRRFEAVIAKQGDHIE